MQGVGWTELVKNQARRLSRIYLLESKTYQDLVLHCWHRTSSFHPTVPHATLACYPLFEGILQSNLATLVMHAEPALLSAALSWWWLTSFISQVYAVLSILIPEALCISCYDCFLLSLFSSFLSMSASPFFLCVTSSYQLLFFIFLPFSWRKDSSGCMPDRGKMGRMREGILLRWNVAAFAMFITWTLCVLSYSSHCPNWFFALMPRTCTL